MTRKKIRTVYSTRYPYQWSKGPGAGKGPGAAKAPEVLGPKPYER